MWAAVVAVVAFTTLPAALGYAVERAPGTGKPPTGTGINTPGAFANRECDKNAGPYGRLNFVTEGSGPVCLAVWNGADNGGATYQGVTKDSITAVVLVPNDQQLAAAATARAQVVTNYATRQDGTVPNALADALAAYEHAFGSYMYGRTVELDVVTSTGDDEAAQRADAVAVKAKKPFVVIDGGYTGLPVFDTEIAKAKTPIFSQGTTVTESLKQAPYRWGQTDSLAGAINVAEFAGKQLAGKKAEYAGDPAMHNTTRKLGMVYADTLLDTNLFDKALTKYGADIAPGVRIAYPGNASPLGDPTVAQEQAPTAITKLKAAGVTSVLVVADSAMTGALTKQATAQDYHPEWIISASQFSDVPFLARSYDQDQWAHAFGISNLPPSVADGQTTATPNVIQWYWGQNQGTYGILQANQINWLIYGILYAGPKLTPQTFKQGYFSVPAAGGSASSDPELANRTPRGGFGRTNGLPYEEYLRFNKDFIAVWWDRDTVGPPGSTGLPGGKGTLWYLDDARRYVGSRWPTKRLNFFDKSNAMYQFESPPTAASVMPCTGCPSETGQGTPAASAS